MDSREPDALVALIAARVAYELSNPLTNLSSRLELMLGEAADREGQAGLKDDLQALHRNARRLIHLVEALRACSGEGPSNRGPVRLNEVTFRALASAGLSRATVALDPEDPRILGDPEELEKLVVRMLACRTSREGDGVRVVTSTSRAEPYQVVLAISGVDRVPDLVESSRDLLAAHSGTLDVESIGDREALVLTLPRLTLRLPFRTPENGDRADGGLERVALDLMKAFDVSELAQQVTERMLPLFHAQSASTWLRRPDDSLVCVATAGRGAESPRTGDTLPGDRSVVEPAAPDRLAVWAPAVIQATGLVGTDGHHAPGDGPHAVLAVPLIVRAEVIGAIVAGRVEPGGFAQAELDLAGAFADEVAPAMRNVQLFMRAEAARAAAEAASLAKDESLALLAHEFRNSLAPIMMSAALIRRVGPPDGVVQDSADIVKRQTRHLARLLDDLLDVSRIARGELEVKREPVSVVTVLERAVETVRRDAEPIGLTVSLSVPPGPLWVEADPTRMQQIVGNILDNAVKYTKRGGRIEVTAAAEDGDAVLCVQDTGIGILPEILPHVFDPFFRSPQARKHTPTGVGIGLTLVRRLAELHGGRVAAHSEGSGRGSTFTVRLPLSAEAEPVAPAATAASPARAGCEVLIIEDDADTRQMLSALLEHEGHRVHVAGDGPSGLAQDEVTRPGVVLIDIDVPGLDGYQIAPRIRACRGAEPLLVALTGHGRAEDRHRSFEAGFDVHLTKPVLSDELLRVLDVWGSRASGGGVPRCAA